MLPLAPAGPGYLPGSAPSLVFFGLVFLVLALRQGFFQGGQDVLGQDVSSGPALRHHEDVGLVQLADHLFEERNVDRAGDDQTRLERGSEMICAGPEIRFFSLDSGSLLPRRPGQ